MSVVKQNHRPEQDSVDIKLILFRIMSKWHFILLGLILAIAGAKLYLRYQENIYLVSSTLHLKTQKQNYRSLGAMELFDAPNLIGDEIQLIKSHDMISKVIDRLDFDVSYYHKGDIRTVEFYQNAPIKVILDTSSFQTARVPFNIHILNSNTFRLQANVAGGDVVDINTNKVVRSSDEGHINKVLRFGEKFEFQDSKFTVILTNPYYKQPAGQLFFVINNHDLLANEYKYVLQISPTHKESSILRLSASGPIVAKNIAFLNMVAEVYIEEGLREKNRIASNTIEFIDSQLHIIADSLERAEKQIENFQMKYNYKGSKQGLENALSRLDALEAEKGSLLMKTEYYKYVLDYIKANKDLKEIVAPSSIGIEDEILGRLINDLIKTKTERALLVQNTSEKNRYIIELDNKIETITSTLYENVNNILKVSDIPIKNLNKRIAQVEGSLSGIPEKDRIWVDIQRKLNLNNHLYNFLLERRAEAGITKASAKPDHAVVERASWLNVSQIAPNASSIYTIALLLGIVFPLGIIILVEFMNDKIRSKDELEKNTDIPILGIIGHKEIVSNLVVSEQPKSAISEAFRAIRINLNYFSIEKKNKLILITSSVSGEGKSFFSMNLANIIAITGKRTLLLGADLRKPKIYDDFGMSNSKGLSSYLSGSCGLTDIINKTKIENFDVITAGPVPPNPAELLGSKQMEDLLKDLKDWYDFIIVDTPPIGVVADAYYLMKSSDINIYVVRHGYTRYKMLEPINNLYTEGKVANLGLVVNDLNSKHGKYYGYGSTYGYGYYYSKGYYGETPGKKKSWKNLSNWLAKK